MTSQFTHLNQFAFQPNGLEFDAVVLHVDVEVSIARTDATITFHNPGFEIIERR